MADIPLDYGSSATDAPAAANMMDQDEEMDVVADQSKASFYPMPADQGVSAGAQRGPSPLSKDDLKSLDDAILLGEDNSPAPAAPPATSGAEVRLDTLNVQGLPITQLSTSRLFAFVTHFGAQPLGLEWVDDQRCNVVFPNPQSARLALEYLCPAVDTVEQPYVPLPPLELLDSAPAENWDTNTIHSLTAPRKAHRIPGKLYTAVEKESAKTYHDAVNGQQQGASMLPDDVPEIYREMEEADRMASLNKPEIQALTKLRSSLWVRHALKEYDVKPSRAASKSQWYREHGIEAGREIVPKLLDIGEVREAPELFPGNQRRGRGRGDNRSVMDELDSQMDAHIASRNAEQAEPRLQGQMMADVIASRGGDDLFSRVGGRQSDSKWAHDGYERQDRGRSSRKERETMDDLDEELERMQEAREDRERERSASPGRVRIKGRGAMKAPGGGRGWQYDDDLDMRDTTWDKRKRSGGGGRSLASRLGEGTESPGLLSRMGGGGKSLAERFG